MNTQDLKILRQQLANLTVRPDRLIAAIDTALMEQCQQTNAWLREELEAFNALHG